MRVYTPFALTLVNALNEPNGTNWTKSVTK
jgi:hypothetical protein